MDAWVVFYSLKGLSPKQRTKASGLLFGKTQQSNYGRYSYPIPGILPEGSYFKPAKSVVVVKKRYRQKLIRFLEKYAISYRCYEIKVDPADFKKEEI